MVRRLDEHGTIPKFIYANANFQNPTGVTMTLRRRQDLLALASTLKELWPLPRFLDEMLLIPTTRRGHRWVATCPLPLEEDRRANEQEYKQVQEDSARLAEEE